MTAREGLNVFPTRIPVQGWTGYLGLYAPSGTLVCNSAPQLAGSFEGAAGLGETRRVKSVIGLGVPVLATVEDKDGYGDETQDKCPQNPALQDGCPVVRAHAKATAKEKSIVVDVGVSSEAVVDVFGQVGWGYKANPKLKTAGSKPKRLIVGLSGPKKTVLLGKSVPFRVPLRKVVLRRLSRLTPKGSVVAKLTVATTDLDGRETHRRLDVTLKGRDTGE